MSQSQNMSLFGHSFAAVRLTMSDCHVLIMITKPRYATLLYAVTE